MTRRPGRDGHVRGWARARPAGGLPSYHELMSSAPARPLHCSRSETALRCRRGGAGRGRAIHRSLLNRQPPVPAGWPRRVTQSPPLPTQRDPSELRPRVRRVPTQECHMATPPDLTRRRGCPYAYGPRVLAGWAPRTVQPGCPVEVRCARRRRRS